MDKDKIMEQKYFLSEDLLKIIVIISDFVYKG